MIKGAVCEILPSFSTYYNYTFKFENWFAILPCNVMPPLMAQKWILVRSYSFSLKENPKGMHGFTRGCGLEEAEGLFDFTAVVIHLERSW